MNRSIAIAGNIGAGKSTLVEFLARHYGIVAFYEPNEENPYLEDFYRDMRGFAYQSQLYFLASKFRLHQAFDRQPGVVALDRTIFEDAEVFATALYQMRKISKRDWATYRSLYEGILEAIRPPDLLIYLRCSLPMLRRRIRLRGRAMEQGMSLSYLRRLQGLYDDWIARYRSSDVLVLETDRLDYVNDLLHRLDVMRRIEAVLPPSFGAR